MKNKKGFTLIELLAVIVILAIIALIATPIVLNMINSAREKSAESSAYGFIDAIEYNNGFANTEQPGYTEINGENLDVTSSTFNNLKLKGKKPSSGTVTIVNGKVTSATGLCFNDYKVNYDGKKVTVKQGCNNSSSSEENSSTPTYTAYNPGDTVKFDPVGNTSCTSGDTCYTWRVITVEDTTTTDKITLQMDHNLIDRDRWSTGCSISTGPDKALSDLSALTENWTIPTINYTYNTSAATINYGTLTCTNGTCKITGKDTAIATNVKARMITVEEVRALTMNAGAASGTLADNWTLASSYNDSFYFSNSGYSIGTKASGTGSTDLAWLVENTGDSVSSGAIANKYGNINSGYWTLSPTSGYPYHAWSVYFEGHLHYDVVDRDRGLGVRPVIEIDKSLLS